MSHDAACMAFVKHPSQGLGEIIGWIEDPRYEPHDYVTRIFPVLDSKVLDVNVTGALCRHSSIDHVDSRLIITKESRRFGLLKA